MRAGPGVSGQLKSVSRMLTWVYAPALCLLSVVAAVRWRTGIPMSYFMRDPAAIAEAPAYIGLVSNIGILLWCATAAICFFSFAALGRQVGRREARSFLLYSGLLTGYLMLDDLFMFHERLLPQHLHIPQAAVYGAYVLMFAAYLVRFRKTIVESEFPILLLALVFFALSRGVDMGRDLGFVRVRAADLLEGGPKLLGIASWFAYLTIVCAREAFVGE